MTLALLIISVLVVVLQIIKILKLNAEMTWNRSVYHDSYAEFMNAINEQEQEIDSLKRQLKEALDAQN